MANPEKRFGAPVLEAYGLTEAARQVSSNPLPWFYFGMIPSPLPGRPEIVLIIDKAAMRNVRQRRSSPQSSSPDFRRHRIPGTGALASLFPLPYR